jgi:ABC-type nitrate/sulfonate/bicarbonate transport system substrate-binding protein
VLAAELNLFKKHGLAVELQRKSTWSEIRDQIVQGELDAAHAPGTLPFITSLGLDCEPCPCVAGMVLSLQGNAITISRRLWEQGVRDGVSLRERIHLDWGRRTYTFGVVFPYSAQYFLLSKWFEFAGIIPEVEVRVVVVPPDQMFPTMKLGYLDGYCVGEPWTSVAVEAGVGVCVGSSTVLAPLHPEKVLMVREDFAENRAAEHERLIAALLEACALCDQPENRQELSALLSQPQYVNAPRDCFQADLPSSCGPDERRIQPLFGSNIFYRYKANEPTEEKAAWITSHLFEFMWGKNRKTTLNEIAPALKKVFRRDIYSAARRKASRQLRLIESGASNVASLRRPSFWPDLRALARRY